MKALLCLGATLFLYISIWMTAGCNGNDVVAESNAAGATAAVKTAAATTKVAASGTIGVETAEQEKDEPTKGGFLDKANALLDKAKSGSGDGASKAKDWLTKKMQEGGSAAKDTTGDSVQWLFDTYDDLKEKGLTESADAKEWLAQDFKSMDAWEYKIELIPVENAEAKLNELGAERWECFDVKENTFYFKRQKQSYLKAIPLKDLMKLIPLMSVGGDGEEK